MELKAIREIDLQQVRLWRNDLLQSVRTPFLLTIEMQADYYKNVICNRQSNSRMWAVWSEDKFVGITGLMNIEFENGLAEISIMIDPKLRSYGLGKKIIHKLLEKGFNELRLENIYGECYYCNDAHYFWRNVAKRYNGKTVDLPNRKYYEGEHHDSLYFNINKEDFYGANYS